MPTVTTDARMRNAGSGMDAAGAVRQAGDAEAAGKVPVVSLPRPARCTRGWMKVGVDVRVDAIRRGSCRSKDADEGIWVVFLA
jgi:hypothetical protein